MIRRAAVALAALFLTFSAGAPAHATSYRYWSFWTYDASHWTYATQGPSTIRPTDGEVQGFRFAVSEDSTEAARPRGPVSFGAICARTPAREDRKRVALVIDFGTEPDAPAGETPPTRRTACALAPSDATTAEALAAVAKPLRYDTNALLCAIAGYPERGCGEPLTTATPASEKGTGPSVGLWAGAAAVAVLGAAAVWQTRRRRHV
ncbi:SCO2322 family protein [Streptomyces cylindrosporus]|uniref:SCO2322 family protein n=1 Tax=Streptomyces cylindrosporus TaxID=2927583 RepID=UPI003558FE95